MSEDGDRYIDGIYNYCDRWCERCPFTSRCLLFAMDAEFEAAAADPDGEPRDFESVWKKLHDGVEASEPFDDAEADEDAADDSSFDFEFDDEPRDPFEFALADADNDVDYAIHEAERERRLEESPIVCAGDAYWRLVEDWFSRKPDRLEAKAEEPRRPAEAGSATDSDDEARRVADAIDVIRWYQFQIGVKLSRAVSHDPEDLVCDEFLSEEDPIQNDANGSAKVALLGIDRSLAAWTVLRDAFPDEDDAILDLLVHLGRLRTATEHAFPDARQFVRPGFDTEQPSAVDAD